jgi:hypothetical protein
MGQIGISLGWNCTPATFGVDERIRERKENGYLTCPFDEMITNLPGVIKCIEDDFKDFTNEKYLELIVSEEKVGGIMLNETLIHNTKYNFIFNHESPGHADLYKTQSWTEGVNHYIDNNFNLFKERYNRRIQNFKNYIKDAQNLDNIIFILSRFNKDVKKLDEVLKQKYPNLKYEILTITPKEGLEMVHGHYRLMKLDNEIIKNELENI